MNKLKTLLEEITTNWKQATQEKFSNHPIAKKFREEFALIIREHIHEKYPNLKVKASAGAGVWASVPWLSILDPDITDTTQDGIYPVYLFKADGTGFYLSLNQGTTNPEKIYGRAKSIDLLNQRKVKLLNGVEGLSLWGNTQIELNSGTDLGRSYEKPNIVAKYYDALAIPDDEVLEKDLFSILEFYARAKSIYMEEDPIKINNYGKAKFDMKISKPFILLAGISGTGKSRFVQKQAISEYYFCSVAVRPDWHEPSDLLGYTSRLTTKAEYIATDVLLFIVKAWRDACELSTTTNRKLANKTPEQMNTFWLCLDEMNLAPVEQYFADYLSVIETREWIGDEYKCDPLLKSATFTCIKSDELTELRKTLELNDSQYDPMWKYFIEVGIPIPPNLIVAGTVNMDETTHGFSRKVIDRALTFDFGKFFPNDFDQYLAPTVHPKTFSFPTLSKATKQDLSALSFDIGGTKTIQFCKDLNNILKDSSFELAFRALNELLISLVCVNPKDEAELQAVWDDFLMMKVLPRIEGDTDKLSVIGKDETILSQLETLLNTAFAQIIISKRPDFFRENKDDTDLNIPCRSIEKLKWMRDRLENSTFTSFWP